MKSFSQRKGLKPIAEMIQVDSINESLRNSLWNALDILLWSSEEFLYRQYGRPHIDGFSKALWFHYFKKPIDTRPEQSSKILQQIRDYFFSCEWNEVYDFLEFVVNDRARSAPDLPKEFNVILESELAHLSQLAVAFLRFRLIGARK